MGGRGRNDLAQKEGVLADGPEQTEESSFTRNTARKPSLSNYGGIYMTDIGKNRIGWPFRNMRIRSWSTALEIYD